MSDTPRADGYRWPAEWERHRATWLAWPHNRATWPDNFGRIPQQYAKFVRTIRQFEPVRLLASNGDIADGAARSIGDMENVEVFDIPTNDAWIRDFGPSFLRGKHDDSTALVDWTYNAWGGKYPPYDLDNKAPSRIAAALGQQSSIRSYAGPLTLEGGSVDANGIGDLLSTQSCLLNAARNPGISQSHVEAVLFEFLSAERVHWLPHGHLAGDDTDGHVDQLARFVGHSTILASVGCSDDDEHYRGLEENVRFLRESRNIAGEPFDVVPLPLPRPLYPGGQRLPASYCDFYVLNDAVVVPAYGDRSADQNAAGILCEHFPGRQVISLDAVDLVCGLGAFHCLSQPRW